MVSWFTVQAKMCTVVGWFSPCETQTNNYKGLWFREVQVLALAQQAGKAPGEK